MRGHSEQEKDNVTTTFEYDDFGQLIECVTEEVGSTSYQYDLNGNVISRDDGSVVTEYEWNDKNGLIGAAVNESTVWQSTYYPDGKRYAKTNTDGTVYYVYDGGKPIGTYNTDWSRRESFGYGLGSRDPVVNTQYSDGQDAYYYVKDRLGNVNMILNADEATEATMAVAGCAIPDVKGEYSSDVNFGAGAWKFDPDLGAYIGNDTNPQSGQMEGWKRYWNAECGHCITEIGLKPWDVGENPGGGGGDPTPLPWPPFISPFKDQGWPVEVDAGDAGLGDKDQYDDSVHHSNGIDWVSQVGAVAEAVADSIYDRPMGDVNNSPNNRSWPFYDLTLTYAYSASNSVSWRQNYGADSVNRVQYVHHQGLWSKHGQFVSQDGPAAVTGRKNNEPNLGPHLHLFMWGEKPGAGQDNTNWQERYFPPMPEIPFAVYLMAVCRYGWAGSIFGNYVWDWSKHGPGLSSGCMAYYSDVPGLSDPADGPIESTLGICAQACHSAAAAVTSQSCYSAFSTESPDNFYDAYGLYGEGGGCSRRCDDAFSDMLIGYWDSFENTQWMEWTFQGLNGPVHSGYLIGSRSWVYEGGIASNPEFADWAGALLWAWTKTNEMMGDAEEPARLWYEVDKNGKDWTNARQTCRGPYQFFTAPYLPPVSP